MGIPVHKLSLEGFLEWENAQPGRNEYFRGEVLAMTGGRRSHGCVVANLIFHLVGRLRGSPCRVFSESMKLQVADDTILYPDVFVTCDRDDLRTEQIFRAPAVVIEVLSPTTQAYDRSKKFALYRRLASLKEYVLVDPDTRRVEGFRAGAEGSWTFHDMSESPELSLPTIAAPSHCPKSSPASTSLNEARSERTPPLSVVTDTGLTPHRQERSARTEPFMRAIRELMRNRPWPRCWASCPRVVTP
jgi:Uma2 family endonuclease